MDHSSGLVFHRPQAASHRRPVVYFCSAVLTHPEHLLDPSLSASQPIDTIYDIRSVDRLEGQWRLSRFLSKFQVVIPKRIRDRLKLRPGQKIQAIVYDDRIELVPVRPLREMRGFLKGIDTTVPREGDRL